MNYCPKFRVESTIRKDGIFQLETHSVQALEKLFWRHHLVAIQVRSAAASHLQHHQQLFHADGLGADGGRDLSKTIKVGMETEAIVHLFDSRHGHVGCKHPQHILDLQRLLQLTNVQGHIKGLRELQVFQQVGDGRGGGHQQSARGGGNLVHKHQQRLQHRVAEAAAHRREFDNTMLVLG